MNPCLLLFLRRSAIGFAVVLAAALMVKPAACAQINVTTDRNPVTLEESFHIVFSTSDVPDGDPDFGPLAQDFDVLGQSSNTSSSWINGKSSKTVQWSLTVMAKHAGTLVIPSIKFGNDASPAYSVTVNSPANTGSRAIHSDQELFLEVEANPARPYVQAQVLYTLKLYTRVEIAQARLSEPELADAVIEKLGDDSNYTTVVDGVTYSVTERKYAVFPQKSGRATIKPLQLTAEVLTGSRPSFSGFFTQQLTKTKRIHSREITLEVKPIPPEFKGSHWLAVEDLQLTQAWSADPAQIKAGEPLTRTLTVEAKGATAGQLPALSGVSDSKQLKMYPDQPTTQEQKRPDGLSASREEKIAIIPAKAGTYRLPAIRIPWFNTRTQTVETATLAETELTAAPAAGDAASAGSAGNAPEPQKRAALAPAAMTAPAKPAVSVWPWLSGALALGWLATILYFLRRPKTAETPRPPADSESETPLPELIAKLKKACYDNDAQAAKDYLIAFGRIKYNVSSLSAIAALSEARLRDEVLLLNRVLYGRDAPVWEGKKLFQAFSEHKAREKTQSAGKPSPLAPLYRL